MKTIGRTTAFAIGMVVVAMAAAVGCHSGASAAQNQVQTPGQVPVQNLDQGADPAAVNMAPADASAAPQTAYPQQQPSATYQGPPPDQYGQQGAPIERRAPSADPNAQPYDPSADEAYDAGQAAIEEADQPPPPLPQYDQPDAPDPDYLWTPGYWSWGPEGYYWVPGAWCAPPYVGALWTPGYWYFYGNRYRFHRGYWGPYVGFYGGVDYGFGYFGTGYEGGFWNGSHFYYNRAVTHVNVSRIPNVYSRSVAISNSSRVSYNGGRGGLQARPRPQELAAARVPHTPPMSTQVQVQREAAQNRNQFYNQNHGKPAMAVAARPVTADRGIQRPANPIQDNRRAPEQNSPGGRPQQGNQNTQRPEGRPAQGNSENRPAQPAPQAPGRPQPGVRPIPQQQPHLAPQPENRPAQPAPVRPQPEARPIPQQQPRPQPEAARPAPRPQPQVRPQPEARPAAPRPQAPPHPQPQARPAPQAHPHVEENHPR